MASNQAPGEVYTRLVPIVPAPTAMLFAELPTPLKTTVPPLMCGRWKPAFIVNDTTVPVCGVSDSVWPFKFHTPACPTTTGTTPLICSSASRISASASCPPKSFPIVSVPAAMASTPATLASRNVPCTSEAPPENVFGAEPESVSAPGRIFVSENAPEITPLMSSEAPASTPIVALPVNDTRLPGNALCCHADAEFRATRAPRPAKPVPVIDSGSSTTVTPFSSSTPDATTVPAVAPLAPKAPGALRRTRGTPVPCAFSVAMPLKSLGITGANSRMPLF